MGFPGGIVLRNLPVNAEEARDTGSIPGKWNPIPVSLPGKYHDRGAWRATAHGVTNRHD